MGDWACWEMQRTHEGQPALAVGSSGTARCCMRVIIASLLHRKVATAKPRQPGPWRLLYWLTQLAVGPGWPEKYKPEWASAG